MSLFCPKCGSLMYPKDGEMSCGCGYKSEEAGMIKDKKKTKKEVEIVEKEVEIYPITKMDCPKCGNKEAYYWTVQMRSSDEPETIFYKCTKCKNQWRQY